MAERQVADLAAVGLVGPTASQRDTTQSEAAEPPTAQHGASAAGRPAESTRGLLKKIFEKPAPTACDTRSSEVQQLLETGITADGEQLALPESERTYLWEVEHYVLLLKNKGLKDLTNHITTFSPDRLRKLLAADFVGKIPEQPQVVLAASSLGEVRREHADEHELRDVNRDEFLAWLQEVRGKIEFAGKPSASFGIKHGAPADRNNMEGTWHVDGSLRIYGETAPGRPAEMAMKIHLLLEKPTEETMARGDWIHGCVVEQLQVGATERYLLQDVAADRGIVTATMHDNWKETEKLFHTGGVFLCDYNRDGCVDMLINDSAWDYRFALYAGRPDGFFEDVTKSVGLASVRGNAPVAFADLDNDGWEDLIVGPDQMFANQNGERFKRVRKFIDVKAIAHVDSISLADINRDGLIDVYLSRGSARDAIHGSWLSGECPDGENRLLLNKGNWEFEDITQSARASGGPRSTFTSVWLDANDDGWPDVFVIHEFGDGVLLVNQQDGTFQERPLRADAIDFGQMGVTCGDMDNNGHVDIYIGQMYSKSGLRIISNLPSNAYPEPVMAKLGSLVAGSQLYRNQGDLKFERVGQSMQVNAVGWAWGAALADMNNDGFLDLYATAGFISRSRNKPDG